MSSTLNEKIRLIIESEIDAPFSTMGISGAAEAANSIEKLILQEKIDLLTKYMDEFMNGFLFSSSEALDKEIEALTKQLNEYN